jgi:hypothetical protein
MDARSLPTSPWKQFFRMTTVLSSPLLKSSKTHSKMITSLLLDLSPQNKTIIEDH